MTFITRVRLIPIVIFAVGALLMLKLVEGIGGSSVLRAGPPAVAAAEGHGAPPASAPAAPAERPKEQSAPPLAAKSSEAVVNERLAERRTQLEERAKQLDQREAILKVTEKKLDERVQELKLLEQRIDGAVTAKQEEKNNQYKNLVVMYENMKPKDAARILDKLDLEVTLELISRMNARRAADILAEMTAEAAQRVTVSLARRGSVGEVSAAGQASPPPAGARELPRVEQKRQGS